MPVYDEETPLLGAPRSSSRSSRDASRKSNDIHLQFCLLAGVPPSNLPKDAFRQSYARRSLYGRAVHKRNAQNRTYMFTAALSNTLLLSQVVLGAALTALGASESSHILITIFGAMNTIIAGVVAYLKSRGQPMRAHMFRDDLDRVVDEIENSEVMWLGIQSGVHGYDEVAIDDSVSVRSEVARLTRLYDKVVRNNTMNDPDMYMNATTDASNAALRARPGQLPASPVIHAPAAAPAPGTVDSSSPMGAVVPPIATPDDPDAAPASAPPKSKTPPPIDDSSKPKPEAGPSDKEPETKDSTKPGISSDSAPTIAIPESQAATPHSDPIEANLIPSE
ncbi:hypothetical protein P153DRAFT_365819 [Dothidotthia symphoricarpi CBS 119687]|uniref:SMODS and SLOG-associating 2TM effector domain-containing protein n=1 Tax=Dothidotthia symphoricarpi CBS 119687 TaxID=1392245 RepID=A0A6A6ALA5_9PLEO|nr:uncharacterized protein P153DRAFT_365819 [Dothidotthia symphoricarpi CBS 119687]KAF2131231.1 hypothetical protein P153DRAFT_365819 [Dothidotthia symphoricarpi CBS 119687]